MTNTTEIWHDWYLRFAHEVSADAVRPGCQPRVFYATAPRGTVILAHGLSDSPRYMRDIALELVGQGFNVLLPLLQGHGLLRPLAPRHISLKAWHENLDYAVETAADLTPEHVSVGGLSTGATLALHSACNDSRVNGEVLLFSAALGLRLAGSCALGRVAEWLLLHPRVSGLLGQRGPSPSQAGDNPYKYAYVDREGAAQLARLIIALRRQLTEREALARLHWRLFAAHSLADPTACPAEVEALVRDLGEERALGCFFPSEAGVSHDGLVLKEAIAGSSGTVHSRANPRFEEMLGALRAFMA